MHQCPHIVVVEDDVAQRDLLVGYLARHGYRVTGIDNGRALRRLIEHEDPSLVMLDVGLPGEDGFALARWLRERSGRVGIIMVTAASDTVDRVVGLETGADDYIAKPFEPRELLARVKSVLRRGIIQHGRSTPRRLAAILAADIAGYSRLMEADEEGTLQRLRALRRELIDPQIKAHDGRIVKTTGDGILIEFASVVDAVRCAIALQHRLSKTDLPPLQQLKYRLGINLGDVVAEGDDILGDGVNIAARLETLAEPGGICISAAAYDQVYGKIDVEFADMGEQQLRNIARPVRAYRVVL
jgi:class 3 adenylate cyclase